MKKEWERKNKKENIAFAKEIYNFYKVYSDKKKGKAHLFKDVITSDIELSSKTNIKY